MSRVPDDFERASQFFQTLEEMGEDEVRSRHAKLFFAKPDEYIYLLVENWLARKDVGRTSAATARAESRSEESLRLTRLASRRALIAMIMAIIAAITAMLSNMDKIISNLHSVFNPPS